MNGPEATQGRNIAAFRNTEFLCLFCMTGRGLLFTDPRVEWKLLPFNESNEKVGDAISHLLKKSTVLSDGEFQKIFKSGDIQRRQEQWDAELIQHFSYRSKRSLYEKMLKCSIKELAGRLTFSPTRHNQLESWTGSRDMEKVVIPSSSSNEEIGRALCETFDRCTNDI